MSETAVLVIDMLNSYRHPDADRLADSVADVIEPVARLVAAARRSDDVDLVYVNDNFGDFTAGRNDLVRAALRGERPDLVKPIVPDESCRVLQKVRHSAFYSTPLGYLLGQLGTKKVILTGQVTEQCILYTALDAHVRHFDVVLPEDAVAHIDPELGLAAKKMMQRNMGAALVRAADCLP
ncbi:MAG: nicF 1 [Mycobacterium sp.]|nr:nicF 1 [Mycobacterium sp.]